MNMLGSVLTDWVLQLVLKKLVISTSMDKKKKKELDSSLEGFYRKIHAQSFVKPGSERVVGKRPVKANVLHGTESG